MPAPLTEVLITVDGVKHARHVLPPGDYDIGRNPECHIRVEAELVSRRHAKLVLNYDHALIEDLGSSNGTRVNGQPIAETTRLWPNQKIQVGAATIELRRLKHEPSDLSLMPTAAVVKRVLPEEFLREKKYDIGKVVAQGGMGAILDAREATIERTVAMKVMLDTNDPDALTRFLNEAKITGQLEHPNIVPIYELGVDENGQPFYTMKMVRGITLKKVLELLARGVAETVKKFPLSALLTVFQKVCDAVAFAHSKHVIHRDLKPENIMLGDFGSVLVMDWGLAKKLGSPSVATPAPSAEGAAPSMRSSIHLSRGNPASALGSTKAGAIMGTPQYMAPEQARGEIETLDGRADIYALGAILFHLLFLRPPVSGTDAMQVVEKVGRGEVEWPAAKELRALPDSLLAVCRKALALDKAARYPRVEELQSDIAAYQNGFATSAEHAGLVKQVALLVKRNRGIFTTAVAAWFVITALAVWFVIHLRASERTATHNAEIATANEQRANDTLGRLRGTAPTFFAQAQALIEKQQFADALEKITYAIELNPAEAEYDYVKGNLLEDLSRIAEARDAYTEALQRNRAHAFARENLTLCTDILRAEEGHSELSKASVNKLNQLMRKEGRAAEAIATVRVLGKDRQALYDTWKTVFAKAGWPFDATRAIIDDDGLFRVDLHDPKLDDISFLRGMPVKWLNLTDTKVSNLRPLEGAPLRYLDLTRTAVTDLRPLRGMKLTDLNLRETKVTDLRPLQGMPLERLILLDAKGITDLSPLWGMPLKVLDIDRTSVTNIRALEGMPLTNLHVRALSDKGFGDYSALKGMRLSEFAALAYFRDSDLALLKGMPIEVLSMPHSFVTDLRPLQAMPLKELKLDGSKRITDLSPLAGMKLALIDMRGTPITDLSPLRGQPIERAKIDHIPATDFSVVATWPLKEFQAPDTKFSDLTLFAGKPIQWLDLENTPVSDLSPLRGIRIRSLFLYGTKVTDLHLLADLPDLEELTIPAEATDIEFLRRLPNLQNLDNHRFRPGGTTRPAADFWKEYDAKRAQKK